MCKCGHSLLQWAASKKASADGNGGVELVSVGSGRGSGAGGGGGEVAAEVGEAAASSFSCFICLIRASMNEGVYVKSTKQLQPPGAIQKDASSAGK
jgi:hypothetical protein